MALVCSGSHRTPSLFGVPTSQPKRFLVILFRSINFRGKRWHRYTASTRRQFSYFRFAQSSSFSGYCSTRLYFLGGEYGQSKNSQRLLKTLNVFVVWTVVKFWNKIITSFPRIVDWLKQLSNGPKYPVRWYGYDSSTDTWKPVNQIPRSHVLTYCKRKKISIPKKIDSCIASVLTVSF